MANHKFFTVNRREGINFVHSGIRYAACVDRFPDGRVAEIFLSDNKGAMPTRSRGMLRFCSAWPLNTAARLKRSARRRPAATKARPAQLAARLSH